MKSAPVLLALAFVSLACVGRPIPLVARAGTTIGLALPAGAGGTPAAALAYGTANVADPQRGVLVFELKQGSTVVAQLPTRLVTKVVPDPASEAGLSGFVEGELGPTSVLYQGMALVDIPSSVLPAMYQIQIRRVKSLTDPTMLTPDPPDSVLYQLEVIGPQGDSDFTPYDHEEFGSVFTTTQEGLQSIVPNPKLILKLPQVSGQGWAAAATIEIAFDPDLIEVRGAILNTPPRAGALVTWQLPEEDRVRVHYANPRADGEDLALVFRLLTEEAWAPVSATNPAHFSLVEAHYYNWDGFPMAPPSNPFGNIR